MRPRHLEKAQRESECGRSSLTQGLSPRGADPSPGSGPPFSLIDKHYYLLRPFHAPGALPRLWTRNKTQPRPYRAHALPGRRNKPANTPRTNAAAGRGGEGQGAGRPSSCVLGTSQVSAEAAIPPPPGPPTCIPEPAPAAVPRSPISAVRWVTGKDQEAKGSGQVMAEVKLRLKPFLGDKCGQSTERKPETGAEWTGEGQGSWDQEYAGPLLRMA